MKRLIGLDIGDKRIGIAVSDTMRLIASPHSVIIRSDLESDLSQLLKLQEELDADSFIVGLPLNMDGSRGFQCEKVQEFVDNLEAEGVSTILWDERLSTKSAERSMIEAGVRRNKRKMSIDSVAAALILQSYLNK
ncbi:MAG TPA: Holliday junction resolvase RuvX [Christensenellaceae bacterium]|jgi:putative Holliday junction resolvase|nr:Holliday junction resolvase RuvX [Christensenellaceae bacterium]